MLKHPFLSMAVGVASIAFASGAALGAQAASHKPGNEVSFCGTVVKTAECLAVVVSKDESYVINGIAPAPAIGSLVMGKGYVGKPNLTCMTQGATTLHSAMWAVVSDCTM